MFSRFFRRERQSARIAAALYGAIVAQARIPAFYARLGVADTVDGRFEMVVAHLAIVLRALRTTGAEGKVLAQAVFDRFCTEMDRSLREMGVGDLSVPKKMRSMAEAYYGRAAAYDSALDSGDREALAGAVRRNLLRGGEGGAAEIATYLSEAARCLRSAPSADLQAGRLVWPDGLRAKLESAA